MFDNYSIAIIIITLVFFLIGLSLSFYFVFIPAERASSQLDSIFDQGQNTINRINSLINTSNQLGEEVLEGTCNSIIYIATRFFDPNTGCYRLIINNPNLFIPDICNQFIPTI